MATGIVLIIVANLDSSPPGLVSFTRVSTAAAWVLSLTLTHSPTLAHPHSITHTYSPTHSLTRSFTDSHTHTLTHPLIFPAESYCYNSRPYRIHSTAPHSTKRKLIKHVTDLYYYDKLILIPYSLFWDFFVHLCIQDGELIALWKISRLFCYYFFVS